MIIDGKEPAPPVVEVTDEVARAVFFAWCHSPTRADPDESSTQNLGRALIQCVQSILGPTLGLVTREEMARAIKETDDAASECDYMLDSDDCIRVIRGELGPDDFKDRKRLEGGR